MKRKLKIVMIVLLVLVIKIPISYGDELPINIYINETPVNFYDVKPFIDENNRTLVPVRLLSEDFGGHVKWLPDSREVVILKDNKRITLTIGSEFARIDDEIYEMDTKALIVNGRTLVPLRFVSEAFDFEINYEKKIDANNNEMSHIINIYNIYLKIASELKAFNQEKFDTQKYDLTLEDVSTLNDDLIDAYPEIYYTDGFYYNYQDQDVVSIQFNYIEDENSLKEKYKQLNLVANQIVESIISDDMTDYEKEKTIHDYLLKNVRYDEADEWPVLSHTAYGALINGVAVCDGYAESFDFLLKKVGIKSELVYGTLDNVAHAWNLVEIEGQKYFVDATANDPINNDEEYIKYTFFNVPYALMRPSHVFDKNYDFIEGTGHNYFHKNDLYFEDIEKVNDHIYNELGKGSSETRINIMVKDQALQSQINLSDVLSDFLTDNSDAYYPSYSYVEMDGDIRFIYDVVVNLEKK